MSSERYLNEAKQAINQVFGAKCSVEETREALKELIDEIHIMLDVLDQDEERRQK